MISRSADFESAASTDFAIQAVIMVRNVRLELTSLSTVASETTAFTDFANRAGAPSQNRTMN